MDPGSLVLGLLWRVCPTCGVLLQNRNGHLDAHIFSCLMREWSIDTWGWNYEISVHTPGNKSRIIMEWWNLVYSYVDESHSVTGQSIELTRRKEMSWKKAACTFLGSKITADGDCSHEIKRHLFLGRKAMTNLDSILKCRDITLLTKVHIVKVMLFPIVMYRCESWTIKKAEH